MSDEKKIRHATALRNQDMLNRMASERFRVVAGKVERYKAAAPAQDVETVLAAEKLANLEIGDLIPGKGIFFGKYELKDKEGNLKNTFNMYAAPEDLADNEGNKTFSYSAAIDHIAALQNWHGHDGTPYASEGKLFKALEDGSYKGGWFMPSSELLIGYDGERNLTTPDNLYSVRNTGEFAGTFEQTLYTSGDVYRDSYWGCTQLEIMGLAGRTYARFSTGTRCFTNNEVRPMACRPVRLEPAP